ncbi:MAG TPA: GNAT family N-acetyltransferase [Solirubrobacteraceae bacterium]|nr:GNAT family N-acetyltransferase [Solirubrobacteraceae bacterium]
MRIRPLQPEDVLAAREPADAALGPPPSLDPAAAETYWAVRFERLVGTDPGGCWGAEDDDGRIVGTALALVRDGVWALAFLAVHPDVQAQGIGRRLLDATLEHAEGARAALIASSTDPKAMRRYARAGFDLRPCVAAGGTLDRSALPAGLRSRQTDDLSVAETLGREVRGGAYDPDDFGLYLQSGWIGLRCGDDGFALANDGRVSILVARDEATATDLLWSALATARNGGNGGNGDADFITAGQDWAIQTVLEAGLALSPDGPIFTRGEVGPLRPWIPAGSFL